MTSYVGTSGNDTLIGGKGDDTFTPGAGNDRVESGNGGYDTLILSGNRAQYQLQRYGTYSGLLKNTATGDSVDAYGMYIRAIRRRHCADE